MKLSQIKWLAVPVVALVMALALPQLSVAQGEGYDDLYEEDGYVTHDDSENLAFGIGVGLVKPDGDGEIYYSAGLRFRIGKRGDDESDGREDDRREGESLDDYNRRHNARHYRGRSDRGASEGIRGFLEPEIAYWSRSANDPGEFDQSDLLVGINLIGVVPTRNADFFFGAGFGLHFTDSDFLNQSGLLDSESDSRLGGNIQFGVDINMTESVAVFGLGRVDILQDRPNDRQTKVQLGLRFKF
jgi:hypothetical protein